MLKPKLNLEIENLMQHELIKNANSQDFSNIDKAFDYLNSAIDTLEEIGFTSYADKILNIIYKFATDASKSKSEINYKARLAQEYLAFGFFAEIKKIGYPIDKYLKIMFDPKSTEREKNKIKLQINQDVRNTGKSIIHILVNYLNKIKEENGEPLIPIGQFPDENDIQLVLRELYMPLNEVRYKSFFIPGIKRMNSEELEKYKLENPSDFIADTAIPPPPFEGLPSISTVKKLDIAPPESVIGPLPPKTKNIFDELVNPEDNPFKNIKVEASKRRPKNPTKVSDRHTKNLTSKKMIKNLKDHGTVFNMADTNLADDLLAQELEFEDENNAEYTHPDLIF